MGEIDVCEIELLVYLEEIRLEVYLISIFVYIYLYFFFKFMIVLLCFYQ